VAVQSLWDTGLRTPGNAALFAVLAAIALGPAPVNRKAARPTQPATVPDGATSNS
jgi:hypothetical protein